MLVMTSFKNVVLPLLHRMKTKLLAVYKLVKAGIKSNHWTLRIF